MTRIRTVAGDLAPNQLGVTDYHDHLFQVSPLLPGDELDDEGCSGREAADLLASGFLAMVDATPIGLGRRPGALARISADTGLTVIAATGAHRQAHYASSHWLLEQTEVALAERFGTEVTTAMPVDDTSTSAGAALLHGRPIRAGLIKTGIDYWRISPFEGRVLAAAAVTHRTTGAPVMVHLEHGSAAFEVLARLGADGVPAAAVALAHIDRNPDPVLHAELAATGAYLGYDGFARTRRWPDTVLLDCMTRAAELGAADRLMIGGDVGRRTRFAAYGGMPGMAYLGQRIVPRVRALGDDLAEAVLVGNPARWLARFPDPQEDPAFQEVR